MSFRMTHNVTVQGYKPFKCHSMHWKRHIDNYGDEAKFVIPATCRLVGSPEDYDQEAVPTGLQFNEGDKVLFEAGYDCNNVRRFQGFIKRINFKVPLEVECEGYSYQLRKNRVVNNTYQHVKLVTILADVVKGTDIKLSSLIPDITVDYVKFQDCNGLDCLDWFKEKMLLTAYFVFDELYVGLRYLNGYSLTVKHQLNWNVIKDDELLFEANKEGAEVNIHLKVPQKTGGHRVLKSGMKNGTVKEMKIAGLDPDNAALEAIRADKQKKQNIQGYSGRITGFLEPLADLNMVSQIIDKKYNERNGKYVIEGIEGSFDKSGGRQKIQIGISV